MTREEVIEKYYSGVVVDEVLPVQVLIHSQQNGKSLRKNLTWFLRQKEQNAGLLKN